MKILFLSSNYIRHYGYFDLVEFFWDIETEGLQESLHSSPKSGQWVN